MQTQRTDRQPSIVYTTTRDQLRSDAQFARDAEQFDTINFGFTSQHGGPARGPAPESIVEAAHLLEGNPDPGEHRLSDSLVVILDADGKTVHLIEY